MHYRGRTPTRACGQLQITPACKPTTPRRAMPLRATAPPAPSHGRRLSRVRPVHNNVVDLQRGGGGGAGKGGGRGGCSRVLIRRAMVVLDVISP